MTFGTLKCVINNAACFADSAFPEDGSIVHFGEHRVYIAVVPEYPAEVLACSGPSLDEVAGCDSSAEPCVFAEVMMA